MKKITLFTVLAIYCIALNAQIAFTKQSLTATSNPNQIDAVLSADFDNDGDIDLVSAEEGYWYENDGNGNFTAFSLASGGSSKFESVAIGDLNNDGYMDIVMALYISNSAATFNNIYAYINDQDGTFTRSNVIVFDTDLNDCQSMEIKDIDLDGKPDVVVSCGSVGLIFWMKQNSIGDYTKIDLGTSLIDNFAVKVFDYDNDNDEDIFYTRNSVTQGRVRVFRNNGGGSWSDIGVDPDFRRASYIEVADTNNDGQKEIFVSGIMDDEIRRYTYNTSSNTFTQTVIHTSNAPGGISFADVNDDGLQDILLARFENNAFFWLENNGNGTSYTNHLIDNTTSETQGSVAIIGADVDNDGDVDIIGGAKDADKITIYKSDLILSVEEDEFGSDISLYPNPTDDILIISNKNNVEINKITITDSYGKIISKISYKTNTIRLSHLSPGIYFITLQSSFKKVTKKIIKQ